MLGAQVDRLRRFIATGNPDVPAEEKAAAAAATAKATEAAADADLDARVDELRREIQGGGTAPAVVNVPRNDAKPADAAKAKPPKPPVKP